MNKTKIDWADSTWNPVTGCLHGCVYCYAKGIARRFAGFEPRCGGEVIPDGEGTSPGSIHNTTHGQKLHVFDKQPMRRLNARGYPNGKFMATNYPYGFEPTLHRHKLDEYKHMKGRTIFVCSMADLFGEWVPVEWIKEVFDACAAAPQHRYLFLTKNPERYTELFQKDILPDGADATNYWFGTTAVNEQVPFWFSSHHYTFVSIEPILGPFEAIDNPVAKVNWVIIGTETKNGKIINPPKREWIENIVKNCRATDTSVFMKESLRGIMGDDFIQEFPWEVK